MDYGVEDEYVRRRWTDVLDAFGAWIQVVELLPAEAAEYREKHEDTVAPGRLIIVGRERVTAGVLMEIEADQDRILAAFRGFAGGGYRGETA